MSTVIGTGNTPPLPMPITPEAPQPKLEKNITQGTLLEAFSFINSTKTGALEAFKVGTDKQLGRQKDAAMFIANSGIGSALGVDLKQADNWSIFDTNNDGTLNKADITGDKDGKFTTLFLSDEEAKLPANLPSFSKGQWNSIFAELNQARRAPNAQEGQINLNDVLFKPEGKGGNLLDRLNENWGFSAKTKEFLQTLKANPSLIHTLAQAGSSPDVLSVGELDGVGMVKAGLSLNAQGAMLLKDMQVSTAQAETIYNTAMEHGGNEEFVAQLIGHARQEAGPNLPTTHSGAYKGLIQWSGSRFAGLQNWAANQGKDYRDLGTQVSYIFEEARRSYPSVYKAFSNPNASRQELQNAFRDYIGWGHTGDRHSYAETARIALGSR